MASNSFILRGDDGQLYRVDNQKLAAYKLPAGDPANQLAPKIAALHASATGAPGVTADLVCFIAMREGAK